MIGNFEFRLESKNLQYKFTVVHKMTKIVGQGAVGKTELVTCVEDSVQPFLGIHVSCKYHTLVFGTNEMVRLLATIETVRHKYGESLSSECRDELRLLLSSYDNHLIFCDETTPGLYSHAFSLLYQFTDAFFVICCRSGLSSIPYSYSDIYKMRTSGKFHWLERAYKDYDHLTPIKANDLVLVEDGKSGFQFFSSEWNCESAGGKDKIPNKVLNGNYTVVIADGAGFGSILEDYRYYFSGLNLFLPISFEYLLLKSQMFSRVPVRDKIDNPEKYATGLDLSLERYYTDLIIELTNGQRCEYSKSRLNSCYVKPCCNSNRCTLVPVYNKFDSIIQSWIIGNSKNDINKMNSF